MHPYGTAQACGTLAHRVQASGAPVKTPLSQSPRRIVLNFQRDSAPRTTPPARRPSATASAARADPPPGRDRADEAEGQRTLDDAQGRATVRGPGPDGRLTTSSSCFRTSTTLSGVHSFREQFWPKDSTEKGLKVGSNQAEQLVKPKPAKGKCVLAHLILTAIFPDWYCYAKERDYPPSSSISSWRSLRKAASSASSARCLGTNAAAPADRTRDLVASSS